MTESAFRREDRFDLSSINGIKNYVFETPVSLPAGDWKLQIEKGDAWVFSNQDNYPLHENQTMNISKSDGPITIRSLYAKSVVKFRAVRVELSE